MRRKSKVTLPVAAIATILISGMASANWTVKRIHGEKNQPRCILESEKKTLYDGYQDTEAFMRLDDKSLFIMTESNIDPNFSDVGLQVDGYGFIRMDKVSREKRALFESAIAKIINQFKAGITVKVQLRFWPTWPTTKTYSVTFSLIGFREAYAASLRCK
ncbi:MAG: hypothetical protein ACE5MG_06945 [Candidatus Methylomirabilales bacterium]